MEFSQQINTESVLDDIISEIQSVSDKGKWFLSSSRLVDLLEMRKEIFYRIAYLSKSSLLYYDVLKGFHESDGTILCKFLNQILGMENVEKRFLTAGIFFSESTLSEISDYFLQYLIAIVENHKLDKELLMLLASATLHFDDAFESYLDDKFDKEVLIDRYVAYYIEIKSIDASFGADDFLKDYLHSLLAKRKIDFQEITKESKHRAYYELYGVEIGFKTVNKETNELLRYFGLTVNSTKADLRKKYKELLKKYHPDLNKEGLEKTKSIIEKYKKLSLFFK